MKTVILAILFNTLVGGAGMMSVAWWNALTSPYTGKPSLRIFWRKNQNPFIFSMITIFGLTTLFVIIPELSGIIQKAFGFTISATTKNGSAFILGMLIYDNVRKKFKIKGDINVVNKEK
jgi:phosphotransferase system  glucose/maltose/N-acetylglucosamine-specific IIC component